MVEGGRGPSFPVVFFDGEREMNIGDVKINPTLEYKPFQLMLSQKIGISPNQISIYLVDRKRNPKAPFTEDRRRIPITGKVNFGLICRQKDCCFLVVLKRSRKSRNRREREFADFLSESNFSQPPQMRSMPENLVLLRRDQQVPFYDQITQSELADLNDRLQSLRIQRENYQMAMGKGNFDSGHGMDTDSILRIGDWRAAAPAAAMMMTNNGTRKVFCEECENAARNGSTTSFHPCVNDAVITRFTPRLGPIERIG
ncbi:hypothetical protein PHJA_000796300 [Phtheirospermum japonicum]|uniref:DUF7138 domain-containing protein n=1 Tax=Phtheirospermum japonicum TaxID=374723 RepID=A0A830BRZ7_9LAMI|nr:hypothetical protein PHJA_000796300 [Phtheirospermum japonicum]